MDIEIGGDTFTKKPNILEEIAYRDTWGKGADSFIAMIYERLVLMRDLLAEDGSIYVHCDWRVNSYVRACPGRNFRRELFVNEIIWKRQTAHIATAVKHALARLHDLIFSTQRAKTTFGTLNMQTYTRLYPDLITNHVDGRRYDDR